MQRLPDDGAGEWLEPALDQRGLREMVRHSTILPQCIEAYALNIAGFGLKIEYREDRDENAAMADEYDRIAAFLEKISPERELSGVFSDLIRARETYGVAYLEVMRDMLGAVSEIEFVADTESVRKTRPLLPYVRAEGPGGTRLRRFRKYKQLSPEGGAVYFREFGDPRMMDMRTGEYSESVEPRWRANELLEVKIGTESYGAPRWIGQALCIDGSRRAESLNNNYFLSGRHTPLAIIINGGSLSDESLGKLKEYADGLSGESGQHSFLLLEAEPRGGVAGYDEEKNPHIELRDMASMLQKDELFQDYLQNNRRKVQSAFRLPDLYVGYTSDFNRATARTAMEITEKQVFQPERKALAWILNNKLLSGFGGRYAKVEFGAPEITDMEEFAAVLDIAERAGGLTPNKAKQLIFRMLGQTEEPFGGAWGELPLAAAPYAGTDGGKGGEI